ncbi:recombination protein RecR [Candidatus Parcubacteria bacterium]|uniref:Recombination protein RecR n=1 Tax=Candidatus Kaiserbacteria bacterium CG10_big_fil_rev_8_21_14_0_10_47_16 TaxID=1974608 RepID=A0A2H0UDJ4_9BACT|nr:recombination protein RecR [Candidatus Parcubacteria bacterium]PIR84498.1 MAG: recombination protein RecR [Candidatus Kaiserbacteria bacterium CG10_big_fil_rev_8_21_14_0_10_47_16]
MTALEKLIKHFERFPGIGSRQARRFAHHLLTEPSENVQELSELIAGIKSTMTECSECYRFFARNGGGSVCGICSDTMRDRSKLTVVERDSDIQSIERSGSYDGLYFVLGGTVPLLDSEDSKKLRGGALKRIVLERQDDLEEIILGFSVNPDGENTGRFVESILKDILAEKTIKLSQLGRGLSTGSELEYADPETIKNALENRH